MRKSKLWITAAFIVLLFFYLIFSATFNIDNFGKGKLESITVVDKCNGTSSCFNTQEISEIESEDEMKSIESIFFYKFASNFLVYTKEEGNFIIIFHYEKTDIEFSVSLDFEEMKGKIKYFERRKDFLIDRQGMTLLKETIKP